jgi:hypothetical protein
MVAHKRSEQAFNCNEEKIAPTKGWLKQRCLGEIFVALIPNQI